MPSDRYALEIPFPEYAFVPGQHPHPISDPRGHSYGKSNEVPEPLNPDHPEGSRPFLFAIDLFNAGYYWEAHETWEGLWIAAGRSGTVAEMLKGLIKLAAAGVKARQGQLEGVRRHAKRATELFAMVQSTLVDDRGDFAGLVVNEMVRNALSLFEQPIVNETQSQGGLPVLPFQLTPHR